MKFYSLHLWGIILAGIVLSACINQSADQAKDKPTTANNSQSASQVTASPTNTPTSAEQAQTYTLTEIAQHNQADDCWFAIEGKVYNVTPFIASSKHPGGEAILQGCGKDATELFNTRPMGSGTPHSDKARTNLANFYIGDLAQ